MKIALIQQHSSKNYEDNLNRGIAAFHKAADAGAELVAFAELAFLPFLPQVKASQLGIGVGEHVYLYALPSVASYVGADIVAGVVGAGVHQRKKLTLYVDIGTNGEIVVGNSDWMATASCSYLTWVRLCLPGSCPSIVEMCATKTLWAFIDPIKYLTICAVMKN